MKEGPDIALIGSMIGDPARSNMLVALMSGKALTASELAAEGGVTMQTASAHLSKLCAAGLVWKRRQGRHRYFQLTENVGAVLESMMGLAANLGHLRTRTGPRDSAMRKARVCYDHIAGEYGVMIFDGMLKNGHIVESGEAVSLTRCGKDFVAGLGIDPERTGNARRPLCRACLDWSARRSHMAGGLGAAFLHRFIELGWVIQGPKDGRALTITTRGEREFAHHFAG